MLGMGLCTTFVILLYAAGVGAEDDAGLASKETAPVIQKKSMRDRYCGILGAPARTDAAFKSAEKIHAEFGWGTITDPKWESKGSFFEFVHYDPGPPLSKDSMFIGYDGTSYTTLVCFNSPSLRKNVLADIEKIVKDPHTDGLLLDMVWWGSYRGPEDWCCCDHCQQQFKEKFGKELPVVKSFDWKSVDPVTMKQGIEWRRDSLEEFYRLVYGKVKSIRPDLPVAIHGQGAFFIDMGNFFAPLDALRLSDFAYWEWYGDGLFYSALLRGLSHQPTLGHAPYGSEFQASNWPASHQFPLSYSRDYINAVVSGMVAHGCRPIMLLDFSPNGLPKDSVSLMEPIYRAVKEKQQYIQDAAPLLYAAIVYSDATKTYYYRHDPERSLVPNLRGAFDVFQRLHVPVEFLCDLDLDLENLKKFKLVVLPNTAVLTKPQVQAITQYVREGGSILATYETSLYDELGEIQGNFALSEVLGLRYVSTRSNLYGDPSAGVKGGACLAPTGDFLLRIQNGFAPRTVFPLFMPGPSIVTDPSAGVTKATQSLDPRPGMIAGDPSAIPAVQVNQFGKGKSAYISAPLFKIYAHTGHLTPIAQSPALPLRHIPFSRRGWIMDLLRELVDELAPSPPIRMEGRAYLECTFFEQKEKNRLIIHLLNGIVREVGEVYPSDPARILVRKDFIKPAKIYSAWPEKKALQAKDEGDYWEITAPGTQIHQIVVLER